MKLKQNISFLFAALAIACGAASQVPKTAGDVTSCVVNIIGAVGGAIDIPAIMASCGASVDDIINIVETWIANNQADAAASSADPTLIRAHQILDAAKAYKAAHP